MKRPVCFDLDGTLFQAHLMAIPAYKDTMKRLMDADLWHDMHDEEYFKGLFGLTEKEIWKYLMPGAPEDVRKLASKWIEEEEKKYLEQGVGELFPGAMDTLKTLQSWGHPLFVVSNGTESYVKNVCKTFGLTPILTGVYSAGEYQTDTKVQLLGHAVREHNLSPGVMVGDRDSDIEAGLGNGFVTVACTYGFGKAHEFEHAHYSIDDIQEVLTVVEKGAI